MKYEGQLPLSDLTSHKTHRSLAYILVSGHMRYAGLGSRFFVRRSGTCHVPQLLLERHLTSFESPAQWFATYPITVDFTDFTDVIIVSADINGQGPMGSLSLAALCGSDFIQVVYPTSALVVV